MVVIVVMWALSASPTLLRLTALRILTAVCVSVSLLLATFLITRRQKAARLNGWLRLGAFALLWLYYLVVWYQHGP